MGSLGRILIADDEETFLLSTGDLLRRAGYECDCTTDAATAADMLKQTRYNLVIADVEMPGNRKLELVREIRSIAKDTPVILVTGYPSLNNAKQAVRPPVVAYLVKPIDFDELLTLVKSSIKNL